MKAVTKAERNYVKITAKNGRCCITDLALYFLGFRGSGCKKINSVYDRAKFVFDQLVSEGIIKKSEYQVDSEESSILYELS